ncbi:MAG: sugar transferase, partial [Alphaproteobacteria bacterium]|nr:sugar transferase [Alphaproteobacteria bacterium]
IAKRISKIPPELPPHLTHVKPGITGWAQVNGWRGETATIELMRRRIECDVWYAKNASIPLDLAILLRTLAEVVRMRQAY